MTKDKYGQYIFNTNDVIDIIMKDIDLSHKKIFINDSENINENIVKYVDEGLSVKDFDNKQQTNLYIPSEYKDMDIAAHILSLCNTQEELQRCGEELLVYQDKGLFDILRYMKYLVDTMKQHNVIWGVGRGSSVSSYVLYKLGVHKIDSMYYKLDVKEFLR